MGLEAHLEQIVRAGTGQLPTDAELADPEFRMRCIRAAYGKGYVDGLTDPDPPDAEAACVEATKHWLRLPVC